MRSVWKRSVIVIIFVIAALSALAFWSLRDKPTPKPVPNADGSVDYKVIGMSVEGRKIESYRYLPPARAGGAQAGGEGEKMLVFVGGIHGGYEWNSVLLSYKLMDYLDENPQVIPDNLAIVVIPDANPDGVFKVTGKTGRFSVADVSTSTKVLASGRFNANDVDLNRNFDCKWKPKSTWRSEEVSGGRSAFSEPEATAIRNFVLANNSGGNIEAFVFWHSQANAVYASECEEGILPETINIMEVYSKASGYPAVKSFDAYTITGDAEGWLASIGIPAITVELKTHKDLEWERNLLGVKALFGYYRSSR